MVAQTGIEPAFSAPITIIGLEDQLGYYATERIICHIETRSNNIDDKFNGG